MLTKSQRKNLRRSQRRARTRLRRECDRCLSIAQKCLPIYRVRSVHDIDGGGEWQVSKTVTICGLVHRVDGVYVRNPRDVNIRAVFVDDVRIGYTMF